MDRRRHAREIRLLLRANRVVAILGARQVGKTTLARRLYAQHRGEKLFFDAENSADADRLRDPLLALGSARGLVVINEIQHVPEVFRSLRVLADRARGPRFLVLGSASVDLLRQSSESLAGRIAFYALDGFDLDETGIASWSRLWLRGGFPRSYLARSNDSSARWRRDFIQTFLQRDLPQLGVQIPAATLSRFWTMLAHYHGGIWNSAEFARSFGVSDHTVRNYLELLASVFVVRVLRPWHENLGKRQVKSPKVYIADSGLLHALLNLRTHDALNVHPKVGASFEGFCIRSILARLGAEPDEAFFWGTHGGAELDLFVVRGRKRRGFEIKLASSVSLTPAMKIALDDLKLDSLEVIHAGDQSYPIAPRIRAVSINRLLDDMRPL